MTIEEAIKHANDVAEFNRLRAENEKRNFSIGVGDGKEINHCIDCAKEHEQLADWLKELKAYREVDAKTYICDVEKNIDCSKTACHINGGECRRTTHKEFALPHDNEGADMREEANE